MKIIITFSSGKIEKTHFENISINKTVMEIVVSNDKFRSIPLYMIKGIEFEE
jgi:hypothetical protein